MDNNTQSPPAFPPQKGNEATRVAPNQPQLDTEFDNEEEEHGDEPADREYDGDDNPGMDESRTHYYDENNTTAVHELWTSQPYIIIQNCLELIPYRWMSGPRRANAVVRLVLIFVIGYAVYASRSVAAVPSVPSVAESCGNAVPLAIAAVLIVIITMIVIRRWRNSSRTVNTTQSRETGPTLELYTPGPLLSSSVNGGLDAAMPPPNQHDVHGRTYARATTSLSPEEGRDTAWLVGGNIGPAESMLPKEDRNTPWKVDRQ